MSNRLHMIFQRLLINRQTAQYHICLPQGQGIALNGIGIISVFDHELLRQPFCLPLCQRSSGIQFCFLPVDALKQAFGRFVPSILRFLCLCRNPVAASLTNYA